MRHQVRRATALCILLAFSSAPAAQAAGSCDTRYFLPIAPGARWTFAREAQPRTVENIQTDSFEVHIAHPTEYQGQPDVIDWVDTYRCGADGLSLVQHSEIHEGAQAGQFGGLYQGLALPRTIGPGSEWEFTYVLTGGDPQQPPAADEVRYHVTEHFTVLGPSTLRLNNSQQLQGLNVQHMIHSVTVTEGVGEQEDFTTNTVEFLAEGVGWVTPELIAYSRGSHSFDQCPDQATADAALHSTEEGLADQSTPAAELSATRALELSIAQASVPGSALVAAFGSLGIPAENVTVDYR